jgi:hypothetical protein
MDLNNAIIDAVGFKKGEMCSFYICNDDWESEQEISLVEMDTAPDKDSYTMDKTRLEEFISEEGQKVVYTFDFINNRSFFMEMKKITAGKDLKAAQCTKSVGDAPAQEKEDLLNEDLFAGIKQGNVDPDVDSDFSDDSGYDEEELGDMNIGDFDDLNK